MGHHTNNYAEVGIRIFKDNVLCRYKVYNALMLINFVTNRMEQQYQKRPQDYALNRNTAQFVWRSQLLRKASHLTEQNVRQSREAGFYLVPSANGERTYSVDVSAGCCTCEQGVYGRFCKHLMAVLNLFGGDVLNAPKVSAEDRYKMAVLAFGPAAQPKQFYRCAKRAKCAKHKEMKGLSDFAVM